MVSFKGSFVFCLFDLYSYDVRSRDLLFFACFIFMVMVSFNGSFVVCLFYLYGYGVVHGIFCCLFVLPLWLWCRSWDLLLFVCFTFMVMVSFKGSFVFCLFYLDSYGVVQGSFCCLFVLPLQLWYHSKDLLLFVCFTLIVMVSVKRSFFVCLFYLDSYGVVQGIFCCLFVLPSQLWCRSRDLLCFACFIFIVMVSFKGSFVFCLFYLYGYGVVQEIVYVLLVLSLWLRVVQEIFYFLFVLPLWLWCRSSDLLFFACFIFIVMVSFKGAFVVCLFCLYGYGVVQGIFCFLLV